MAGSIDDVFASVENSVEDNNEPEVVHLVSDDACGDVIEGDVVALRIKRFIEAKKFPPKIKGAVLKNLTKTSSFLNDCGIRLLDKDDCEYFICMLDPCFNANRPIPIRCSKSGASNATKHMREKHNITSKKTAAANRRMQQIQKQLDVSNPCFRRDPLRWFEVSTCHLNESTVLTAHDACFSKYTDQNRYLGGSSVHCVQRV